MLYKLWTFQLALLLQLACGVQAVQKEISQRQVLASRQLTTAELIRRIDKKAAKKAALGRKSKRTDSALEPRASVAPYQICPGTNVGDGYAVYPDAASLTLVLRLTTVSSVSQCAVLCAQSSPSCQGFTYADGIQYNCGYSTSASITTGGLDPSPGWTTYVPGSCASNGITKECCDSRPYPKCSPMGLSSGYASYPYYDSSGNGILTPVTTLVGGLLGSVTRLVTLTESPSEAACSQQCAGNSDCVAFAYTPGWCAMKQNRAAVVANLQPSSSWSTYIKGSCAELSAYTNAFCCDST